MYEAIIAIESTGPCGRASARSGSHIALWCLDQCDLLSVSGPVEPLREEIEPTTGIEAVYSSGSQSIIVTDRCLRARLPSAIDQYIDRHDCLLLPPLVYEDGAKHCRVLALDQTALTDWYRALLADELPVRVEAKRPLPDGSPVPPHIAPRVTLTDRQRTAVRTAFENGYYEIPRETTTERIADELGVGRRTAAEHLRRAENKLIGSLLNSL